MLGQFWLFGSNMWESAKIEAFQASVARPNLISVVRGHTYRSAIPLANSATQDFISSYCKRIEEPGHDDNHPTLLLWYPPWYQEEQMRQRILERGHQGTTGMGPIGNTKPCLRWGASGRPLSWIWTYCSTQVRRKWTKPQELCGQLGAMVPRHGGLNMGRAASAIKKMRKKHIAWVALSPMLLNPHRN